MGDRTVTTVRDCTRLYATVRTVRDCISLYIRTVVQYTSPLTIPLKRTTPQLLGGSVAFDNVSDFSRAKAERGGFRVRQYDRD